MATCLNNLALLLRATNRPAEAEPLYRRALAIDEAAYGATHPAWRRDLNNLAELLRETNRLEEAEPLFRRCPAIDEAAYGATHPDVATDLNNLAEPLRATNRLEEAVPMRRHLSILKNTFNDSTGHEHPHWADRRLANYSGLLQAMGCRRKTLHRPQDIAGPHFPPCVFRRGEGVFRLAPTWYLAASDGSAKRRSPVCGVRHSYTAVRDKGRPEEAMICP